MTATFEAIQAQAATIDGVPAFWVPGEGEFTAGLTFRVGMADETLSWNRAATTAATAARRCGTGGSARGRTA